MKISAPYEFEDLVVSEKVVQHEWSLRIHRPWIGVALFAIPCLIGFALVKTLYSIESIWHLLEISDKLGLILGISLLFAAIFFNFVVKLIIRNRLLRFMSSGTSSLIRGHSEIEITEQGFSQFSRDYSLNLSWECIREIITLGSGVLFLCDVGRGFHIPSKIFASLQQQTEFAELARKFKSQHGIST